LKRAGTETGHPDDYRRRLLHTRRFARVVIPAGALIALLAVASLALGGRSPLQPGGTLILAVFGLGLLVTALTSLWDTGRTIRRLDERPEEP
jgi:peptidoglycan/LPS O-acetylase OafA/YrhL